MQQRQKQRLRLKQKRVEIMQPAGKAIAAAISIGIAAGLGALGMGLCVGKSAEGIARQPEAEGKIRTTMILGIVFIETAVLFTHSVSILVIFVL
jgi:ATP synthase, F0 subunit c